MESRLSRTGLRVGTFGRLVAKHWSLLVSDSDFLFQFLPPPPSSFRKRSAGRRQQKRPSRARTWRPRNPRQSSRSWGCWSRTGGGRRRRKAKKWLPGAIRGHTRRIEMERHVGEFNFFDSSSTLLAC